MSYASERRCSASGVPKQNVHSRRFLCMQIIRLSGEYDLSRRAEVQKQLEAAREASRVVIDMSDVSYIDSSTLHAFADLRRERSVRDLPPCPLVITAPAVRRIFGITAFDQLWPIYNSIGEALSGIEDTSCA